MWWPWHRDGSRSQAYRTVTALLLLSVIILPTTALAVVNSATGSLSGTSLDLTAASVTLNRIAGGAVTSVQAEINPGTVSITSNINFNLTVQPQINLTDSGLNHVSISIPASYSNLTPGVVSVDGLAIPVGSCPSPTAGTHCLQFTGNILTVTFGTKITTNNSIIRFGFSADTPAAAGSSTFFVTVDDTVTVEAPQSALPGDADLNAANNNTLDVVTTDGLDPFRSTLTANPIVVVADGVATSTLTATLFDTAGLPIAGETVACTSDRGGIDSIIQPGVTSAAGATAGSISSLSPGVATITASGGGTPLNQKATIYFTQGVVMDVRKSANKDEVQIGDVIDYKVELRNLSTNDVVLAQLTDQLPPNFVYRTGSAKLDGLPIADPAGVRTLTFPVGTVVAPLDNNGNGTIDPGEPGYHEISYQLIVSAGAVPGTYINTAFASDVCVSCAISNRAEYPVEVTFDPLFDLGTIIGKVFEDKNSDGWQDADEPGIAGAMVALDNGSYVKTDPYGRYHFPAVAPGERLLKINLAGLGNGAKATTWEAQVVSVTPGLLAKANFGVITRLETSSIGREVEHGLQLDVNGGVKPIDIRGNVSGQYLLINGRSMQLPGSEIRLQRDALDEIVNINGGVLAKPISFTTFNASDIPPESWTLRIFAADGTVAHTLSGTGTPAQPLTWDGRLDSGDLITGGSIYQYQMENRYADGTTARSPRRMFGVDQTSAIAMNLTGSAFITGSDTLSKTAREALGEAAAILRQHPDEKIVIEGHTDSTGSAAYNLDLSRRRAEAALHHLIETEELPADRFVTRGLGEDQPLTSNRIEEGRELNRRVEIKGEFEEVERARLLDQYRTRPLVAINGADIEPDEFGRFQSRVDDQQGRLDIKLSDEQGKTLHKTVRVPTCLIREPTGLQVLPYGQNGQDRPITASTAGAVLDSDQTIIQTRLSGQTEPGNSVILDGQQIPIDNDGNFTAELNLHEGFNVASLIISNSDGITRLADLSMKVTSRKELGGYVVFAESIPYLSVQMPPTDRPLSSELFVVSGETAPTNQVTINEIAVHPGADGKFSQAVTLPQGKSRLMIAVKDPAGQIGQIERQVEVNDSPFFLLAFADGKISQITTSGNLANAGTGSKKEIVTEGRVALYMKGRIAGRYLLTAALDTGTNEFSDLFKDLDDAETDRLLTNLDPDKLYPVYGDSSTLVHDTDSQGKLYLALDSDELHLLVGNYSLDLHGGELASYRRTLFGAHLIYRSKEKTVYGQANTEIELFGAEIRQIHVRDEVDATGGALYYLSQADVIEGSEQVTILVRDQLTGLPLSRSSQQRNIDYSIKYPEGRILFRKPVSSVQAADRLIDSGLLSGNPVSIEIDYEATAESFEQTAFGGRVRQQLGDHLAVGATTVQDETGAGPYELLGVDAEIRLGKGTRLLTEYATSSGSEATVNISRDGGLNYTAVAVNGTEEGSAFKASAELDIGEWFNKPDLLKTTIYHKQLDSGFRASGQTSEQGRQKSGAELLWTPGTLDSFLARFNQEKRLNTAALDPALLHSSMLQWRHSERKWRLLAEFQSKSSETSSGSSLTQDQLAALRIEGDLTKRLTGSAEHQVSITGVDDSRTTLGLDYRPTDAFSLFANATSGNLGKSAEAGANLLLDKSRIYLSQRLTEQKTNRQETTIFGGESSNGPYGSRLYTEYQVNRSSAGHGNVSLFGAEKRWKYDSGLQLMLGGEMGEAQSPTSQNSQYSIASGLTYKHKDRIKLSMRAEFREQKGVNRLQQFLTINRAEGKLNPDLTLIALYRYSISDNRTTGLSEAGFEETSIGLAYRPTKNDIFNALTRGTHLTDRRPTGTGNRDYLDTVLDTLSLEWSLQVTRSLEWIEKNAVRWKEENSATNNYDSRSWLSLHRFNYLFKKSIDAGLEYRRLTESASSGLRQGWLSEIGWRPKREVRLGIGYNFTDFSDDERSLNNYSTQGWFLRIQGIY